EEADVGVERGEKSTRTWEFPDGGLRAWATVFGMCVVTSFGVFEEHYSVNQLKDKPLSSISWIGSLQLSLVLLVGCVSGPMFDAGYLKSMIAFGGTLYVFCLFMTSISTQFYQFVLSQGLGVGVPGASIGGTVSPIAMRRLFDEVGFPWAVRTLAFLVLFCMTIRLSPPRKIDRIVDIPYRAYCFLVLGISLISLGLYGVTYAVATVSHPTSRSTRILSILNAVSLAGRLLPNLIAQRVGPINMLICSCSLAGILAFVWVSAHSTAAILAFNGIFGFASVPAALVSLSVHANNIGLRLGMMFFCSSFAWLASSPIQGALLKVDPTYRAASIFSGCVVLSGVSMVLVARVLVGRRTGKAWV
ncbi:major facilitator superfamily domain-containing protein, partial [Mycena alexandri]